MTLWVLELQDEKYGWPIWLGVYSTAERAEAAWEIIMKNLQGQYGYGKPEERYSMAVVPVYLDSFIDAAMYWVGS